MKGKAMAFTLMFLLSLLGQGLNQTPTNTFSETPTLFQAGDTVDCGMNAANITLEVESDQDEYDSQDTFAGRADVYCGLWDTDYSVNWSLYNHDYNNGNGATYSVGSIQFQTNNSTVTYHSTHTDHMNENEITHYFLASGNWTFYATLYVDDGAGGWSVVSTKSDDFYVTTNISTTVCGYNPDLIGLDIGNYHDTVPINSTWTAHLSISCVLMTTTHNLSYHLVNLNDSSWNPWWASDYHNFSMESPTGIWTFCNNQCSQYNDGSGWYYSDTYLAPNLPEGEYELTLELDYYNSTISGWDEIYLMQSFSVTNNSTGQIELSDGVVDIELFNGTVDEYGDVNYNTSDVMTAVITAHYLVIGEEYRLDYSLWDSSNGVTPHTESSWSWIADQNSTVVVFEVDVGDLYAGGWGVEAWLYANETGTALDVDNEQFSVSTAEAEPEPTESCEEEGLVPSVFGVSRYTIPDGFEAGDPYSADVIVHCPAIEHEGLWATNQIRYWVTADDTGAQTETYTHNFVVDDDGTYSTIVNITGVESMGPGNYTLYTEWYVTNGGVSPTYEFVDDDIDYFFYTGAQDEEPVEPDNPCEGLEYVYGVSRYTTSDGFMVGDAYSADFVVDCPAANGALNQIRYWVTADDAGTQTPTYTHDFTSQNHDDYMIVIEIPSISSMGAGNYTLYTEWYVSEDGSEFVFIDDDIDSFFYAEAEDTEEPGFNFPPITSSVSISPNIPLEGDELICTFTTFDADNDVLTTTIVWEINGEPISEDTANITSGYEVGDEVKCTVVASDGAGPGNTDSDTTTILPSIPTANPGQDSVPSIGMVGTLVAIAFGVGLTRRNDE
jgi:hypothetical protein